MACLRRLMRRQRWKKQKTCLSPEVEWAEPPIVAAPPAELGADVSSKSKRMSFCLAMRVVYGSKPPS
eukprot:2225133-Amphidinium_carterae.1